MKRRKSKGEIALGLAIYVICYVVGWALLRYVLEAPNWAAVTFGMAYAIWVTRDVARD